MAAYIYKIKNTLDGKMYIGKSEREDIEDRWGEHMKKYKKEVKAHPYLYHAMEKYGTEQFSFQIICICFSDDVNDLEPYYIQKYNTLVPNGYNLQGGGEGGKCHEITKQKISESLKGRFVGEKNPFFGKTHTKDVRERISQVHMGNTYTKGMTLSAEAKQKISDANKGKTPWNKGKPWSDEVRAKLSAAKKGKIGKDHNKSIPIFQYTKEGEFVKRWDSASDVARSMNNTNVSGNVGACALGKLKTAYGFIWRYENNLGQS